MGQEFKENKINEKINKRINNLLKSKVAYATYAGITSTFLATAILHTDFSKFLKIENFIIREYRYKHMPLVRKQEHDISFEEITKPTNIISNTAIQIVKNSKTSRDVLNKTIDFVSKNFKPKTKNIETQLPKDIEVSKVGDCNELAFYIYSLLKECEKIKDFGLNPTFTQVYKTNNGDHINHTVIQVTLDGKKYYVDILSDNKIQDSYKLFRNLDSKQVVANYYEDLASYYAMNAKFAQAEIYMNKALKLDPSSPSILYNRSRLYSYMGKNRDALRYAERAVKTESNWIYGYIRKIQVYYDLDDYKKMKEVIESVKKVDPENKFIKMYEGIVQRYESSLSN